MLSSKISLSPSKPNLKNSSARQFFSQNPNYRKKIISDLDLDQFHINRKDFFQYVTYEIKSKYTTNTMIIFS